MRFTLVALLVVLGVGLAAAAVEQDTECNSKLFRTKLIEIHSIFSLNSAARIRVGYSSIISFLDYPVPLQYLMFSNPKLL